MWEINLSFTSSKVFADNSLHSKNSQARVHSRGCWRVYGNDALTFRTWLSRGNARNCAIACIINHFSRANSMKSSSSVINVMKTTARRCEFFSRVMTATYALLHRRQRALSFTSWTLPLCLAIWRWGEKENTQHRAARTIVFDAFLIEPLKTLQTLLFFRVSSTHRHPVCAHNFMQLQM